MKKHSFLFCFVLLWAATPAFAHRLDEYLQATIIDVATNQITLQMRLTPGVSVADSVIKEIDTDGNGSFSEDEQRRYAEKTGAGLSLKTDGSPLTLRLESFSYPRPDEITNGLGEIVLSFVATLPPGSGSRQLTLENRNGNQIAVFLVNCLVPADPKIQIVSQQRNFNQSFYQLNYTVADAAAPLPAKAAPGGISARAEATQSFSVFKTYFAHGVRHILTGYDHLLFITALVLAAKTFWDLFKIVTAFTIAHSVTLTLAALGLVHVSSRIVEPFISASIVFVAVQNIFWPEQAKGWTRLGVAFFFGLFHGLGFAGGLLDVMREMHGTTIALALVGFSAGVEAGHQIVILPLFSGLKWMRSIRTPATHPQSQLFGFQRIGSAFISVAGVYYLCLALAGES